MTPQQRRSNPRPSPHRPRRPSQQQPRVLQLRVRLLSDNFDDPGAGRLPRTSADAAHYERGYAEGEYVLYKVDPEYTGSAFATLPGTFGNSSLAVDARIVGDASTASVALYCRIQPGSSFNGYSVLVFPGDGFVRLYRYNDGTATPMTDGITSAAVRRGNETNRLEFGCAGPTISVTVNGTRVAAVGDGTFQQGQMRVSAIAPRATVQARLDNLVVTQVAEEAAPPPPAPPRYDGSWSGKTTDGRANNFSVRNDSVVQVAIEYVVEGGRCSVSTASGPATVTVSTPARIDGDSFSATVTRQITVRATDDQQLYPGTLTITMNGSFTAPTTASGQTEFVLSIPGPGFSCFGSSKSSWTATKS
jgi:hypothetical protein